MATKRKFLNASARYIEMHRAESLWAKGDSFPRDSRKEFYRKVNLLLRRTKQRHIHAALLFSEIERFVDAGGIAVKEISHQDLHRRAEWRKTFVVEEAVSLES